MRQASPYDFIVMENVYLLNIQRRYVNLSAELPTQKIKHPIPTIVL